MISIALKAKRSLLGAFGVLVLLLGTAFSAKASHLAAADIWVDYIGNGVGNYKYRVTIAVYRSCESTLALDSSQPYTITAPGCFRRVSDTTKDSTISRTAYIRGKIDRDTLDQLCAAYSDSNNCRKPGSPYPGFVRYVYYDTVVVPFACANWTFAWFLGNRNGSINNLIDTTGGGSGPPSNLSIYVSARVNNAFKYNTSSPRFTINPLPYICVNQKTTYLNGPADPNGDSIRIINVIPRNNATGNVGYGAGFSLANPIAGTNGYTVDPNTATASFTPTISGKFVLSFKAFKYDRLTGTPLGYVERDVQVVVLPCPNPPPTIDTIPLAVGGGSLVQSGAGGNVITVCPKVPLTFSVTTAGSNPTGSVILSSNNASVAIGSTFTVTGQNTNSASGTFTWTPDSSDIGDHTLIFTTTDSSCQPGGGGIVQKNYIVVLIKVPSGIKTELTGFYCPNGGAGYQMQLQAPAGNNFVWTALGGSGNGSLSCLTCQNPIARPDSTTTYAVITANYPSPYLCKQKDTVTVYTNNVSILNGPEAVLCRPGYIQLDAVASGPKPSQVIACGLNTFSTVAPDTVQTGVATTTTTVQTPFNSYYSTARTQLLYRSSELQASGLQSSTIRTVGFYVTGTPNTSFANFNIALKCTPTQTLTAAAGFEPGATTVYAATTQAVTPGWNYFSLATPYNWDTTQNLLVNVCFTNPNATYTVSPGVQYTPTSYNSVLYAYNTSGTVCQFVTAGGTGPIASVNRANIRFGASRPDTVGYIYSWKGSSYLSDSSVKNPIAYVPRTVTYNIYAEGKNGCLATDKITLFVPSDSFSVSPIDTAICYGEGVLLQASPAAHYVWFENGLTPTTLSCTDCPQPIAKPLTNTTYTLISSNFYGASNTECPDSNTVNVTVKPLPVVNVYPRDTVVKFGRPVRLLATGANLYYWTPATGLSAAIGTSLFATPEDTAVTYTVTGLAENGCRDTAQARVRIDYRDNLLVPTAFTPNADRINDEFKIANLTFQKLAEFRVFNRWGQEIFATTDGAKGWDGTWKGVEQPSGVYQYIIRVAFPDGITDTYKGNVTLIR